MTEPNVEEFHKFAARAAEGPVVMLNLLAFVPDGGRERYGEYMRRVRPMLAEVGGTARFLGNGAELLLGTEHDRWDEVLLVEYPNRGALIAMSRSEAYQEILPIRNGALTRSVLLACDPVALQDE